MLCILAHRAASQTGCGRDLGSRSDRDCGDQRHEEATARRRSPAVPALEFADVAEVIGCSDVAARQHASRGRRRLTEADPAPRPAAELLWSVLGEMGQALLAGDVGRLSESLP